MRHSFRLILGIGFTLLVLVALGTFYASREARWKLWVDRWVVNPALVALRDQIPEIQINHVKWDAHPDHLKNGILDHLEFDLALTTPIARVPDGGHFSGKAELVRKPESWTLHYGGELTLHNESNRLAPLRFDVTLILPPHLKEIRNIKEAHALFEQSAENQNIFASWITSSEFKLNVDHKSQEATTSAELTFEKLQLKPPSSLTFELPKNLQFTEASLPHLKIEMQKSDKKVGLKIEAADAEALAGAEYFDLPISQLPLSVQMDLPYSATSEVDISSQSKLVTAIAQRKKGNLTWRIGLKDLSEVAALLTRIAEGNSRFPKLFGNGGPLRLNRGKAHAHGTNGTTQITLEGIDLEIPSVPFATKDASLELSFLNTHHVEFSGSLPRLGFRHTQGKIAPFKGTFKKSKKEGDWEIAGSLPLSLSGLDLHLDPIAGTIDSFGQISLNSGIFLKNSSLSAVSSAFCLGLDHPPPTPLEIDFKNIQWRYGKDKTHDIDILEGSIFGTLFEGTWKFYDLGVFNLGSEVPEVDVSFELEKARLDQLGEWLGFGEMDGTLNVSLDEAVTQGWLPTQFGFKLEAKPFRRNKIVFSPDAMKNTVRLFAGGGIDELPGVANWLAFGWPSRLFGGYDVQYAGVSLFSTEGSILLETLDPPEIVSKERKHFILYGPRFKMPLQTSHYPLVMDAVAMGNFVRQVFLQLKGLSEKKHEKSDSSHPVSPEKKCELPSF